MKTGGVFCVGALPYGLWYRQAGRRVLVTAAKVLIYRALVLSRTTTSAVMHANPMGNVVRRQTRSPKQRKENKEQARSFPAVPPRLSDSLVRTRNVLLSAARHGVRLVPECGLLFFFHPTKSVVSFFDMVFFNMAFSVFDDVSFRPLSCTPPVACLLLFHNAFTAPPFPCGRAGCARSGGTQRAVAKDAGRQDRGRALWGRGVSVCLCVLFVRAGVEVICIGVVVDGNVLLTMRMSLVWLVDGVVLVVFCNYLDAGIVILIRMYIGFIVAVRVPAHQSNPRRPRRFVAGSVGCFLFVVIPALGRGFLHGHKQGRLQELQARQSSHQVRHYLPYGCYCKPPMARCSLRRKTFKSLDE